MMVAGMSMIMEFSTSEEVPTFVALANTLLAVPILVAPILGGWLVDTAGYQALFVVALSLYRPGLGEHALVGARAAGAAACAAAQGASRRSKASAQRLAQVRVNSTKRGS